jgi:glycosyltransferase involved in cell wall biosynthesis
MRILLVAFKFPPMGGIGTRRWAKFAKYFTKKGVDLDVLTVKYPYRDTVNWSHDVDGCKGLRVFRLPSFYPSRTFSDKARERNLVDSGIRFLYRRFFIDFAVPWGWLCGKKVLKLAKSEKYDAVIFTGPPSSVHSIAKNVKDRMPTLKLVQDYRDPWNTDRDYSLELLGSRLRKRSLRAERMSCDSSDMIVVVSEGMRRSLAQDFHVGEKIEVITNGFDPDDFNACVRGASTDGKMRIVYGGRIGIDHNGRHKAITMLVDAFARMENFGTHFNGRLVLYSDLTANDFDPNPDLERYVEFRSMLSPDDYILELAKADVCLMINDQRDAHAFGTKVFDYMALGKRILLISPKGDLSDVLTANGQFVADYSVDAIAQQLTNLALDVGKNIPDYSRFSLERISDQYIKCLERLS